jgi:hypothetical protein
MLKIHYDQQTIHPGDSLSGDCAWKIAQGISNYENINLCISYTISFDGKIVDSWQTRKTLLPHGEGESKFQFKLPDNAPPSYAGKSLQVAWQVALVQGTGEALASVPLQVLPKQPAENTKRGEFILLPNGFTRNVPLTVWGFTLNVPLTVWAGGLGLASLSLLAGFFWLPLWSALGWFLSLIIWVLMIPSLFFMLIILVRLDKPVVKITPGKLCPGMEYQAEEDRGTLYPDATTELRLCLLEKASAKEIILDEYPLLSFSPDQAGVRHSFSLPQNLPMPFRTRHAELQWDFIYLVAKNRKMFKIPPAIIQTNANLVLPEKDSGGLATFILIIFTLICTPFFYLSYSHYQSYQIQQQELLVQYCREEACAGEIRRLTTRFAETAEPEYEMHGTFPALSENNPIYKITPQGFSYHFEIKNPQWRDLVDGSRWELRFDPDNYTWHCTPAAADGVDAAQLPEFCRQ